jgi:hypothetical protein
LSVSAQGKTGDGFVPARLRLARQAAALADEAEDGLRFPCRVLAAVGENDNHDFAVVHVKISFAFGIFALRLSM